MAQDLDATVTSLLEEQKGILDPVDRISEIIFGLIMALTFTGSISVANSGRSEVRELLIGALGCNVAWGLVDAVMYVISATVERARRSTLALAVQRAADPARASRLVRQALPPGVAAALTAEEVDGITARIRGLPPVKERGLPRGEDFREGGMAGLLVLLATLPVTVPFLLIDEVEPALRVSNAVAVVMLFVCGYSLGRAGGLRPWVIGGMMVLLGSVLVGIIMALGG